MNEYTLHVSIIGPSGAVAEYAMSPKAAARQRPDEFLAFAEAVRREAEAVKNQREMNEAQLKMF